MFEFFGALAIFILGVLSAPLLIFIRARRNEEWDDSNMTNIYRIFAHLATNPQDFGKMQYPNGDKPFWYINKDEFSDIVKSRPEDD
jgi:hypothetical protein